MGLRGASRRLQEAWGLFQAQPALNPQQQRYLDLILARLCPSTLGGSGSGGGGAAASGALKSARAWASSSSSSSSSSRSAGWAAAVTALAGPQAVRRGFATGFTPSRLMPRQARFTAEDAAFWGIVVANAGVAIAARADAPDARDFALRHLRASVESVVAGGRYHTLLTCVVSHYSAVHLAVNLLMLALFRRVQPLSAGQLLGLYAAGGVAGAAAHVAWYWYDADGPQYGLKYAINTPAFFGCSGGVAAVTAYKAVLNPAALSMAVVVPIPILFALLLYGSLEVKEAEYCDGWPAKTGGMAVGVLAALSVLASRGRRAPPVG